jgi:alkyl hydroperoxide reductase subunit AhpC
MKTFQDNILAIFDRIRTHNFHPVRDGFTYDRNLDEHGVADLNDRDWLVRTLAVRDLVRIGKPAENYIISALLDENHHIRHVAAMTAGILRSFKSVENLESTLLEDSHEVVRSQAAVSLWQIGDKDSSRVVKKAEKEDNSKDVRHQAELAAYAIRNNYTAAPELAEAWRNLEEDNFNKVETGKKAPDFELPDTENRKWQLSDHIGEKPVVLIWIFADWCPVCHREFAELIEMREELQDSIQFITLECHDIYPARVMAGKELEPHYWFSEESFRKTYTKKIWWPHLADRAAGVGTAYGVQPMAFTVHSEWINRPAVVIIDGEGMVRFTYYGTFWGDRPTIADIKEMIETGSYDFESEKRLKKEIQQC